MSHVVVIVGISGREAWLDRDGRETMVAKEAKPFRSADAAKRAADDYFNSLKPFISRQMEYRIEENK